MNSKKRLNPRLFERWQWIVVVTTFVMLAVLVYVAAFQYKPWTSVVADLDHDGLPDTAYHATAEQCVSYIHDLGVTGTCGLQCDRTDHCMQTLTVGDNFLQTGD